MAATAKLWPHFVVVASNAKVALNNKPINRTNKLVKVISSIKNIR